MAKQIVEQEPDTNKLKDMLERDRKLRGEQCMAEINAVLEKFRCRLSAIEVKRDGQIVQSNIEIVPLD